ncbi:hypothetical protein QYM36_017244 [Artemia franciscana]|nr:hypothetical protein QYM36_017244 [Artemia franciscana]
MLVVNLAVADFFMMQTQAPMYIVTVFSSRWWIFDFLWCKSYAFAGSVTGIAAILTMVFIGYDRYNVIVKGINGPVVTKLKAAMFIIFIWAYAVGISLPPLLEVWGSYALEGMLTTCGIDYLTETFKVRSYLLFIFSGSYVLCLSSLVFFYSQIVSAVWTHEKTLKEQAKKMNVASLRSNAEAGGQSAEFRIAKVALINVLIWVCAWTPYGAVSMIGAFGNREIVYPLVGQLPSLATKFASCFNPLIYAISHPKFRLALKEYAPWVCINEPEIKPSNDSSSEKTVTTS